MNEYKGLGDFLLNGTQEDKEEVFGKVIKKSVEKQNLVWHIAEAIRILDKFYDLAEYQLSLIDKYKVSSPFLKSSKDSVDGACRREALKSKTLGLVFHDRYKLLLEDK